MVGVVAYLVGSVLSDMCKETPRMMQRSDIAYGMETVNREYVHRAAPSW